jgi:hypothetical protein
MVTSTLELCSTSTGDNLLEHENFDNLHGDDDDETGLNSLGGGSEYCTIMTDHSVICHEGL